MTATAGPTMSRLLVLTDRTQTGGRPLVDVVASAIEGGARSFVFREKDLPAGERAALAADVRALVHEAGGLFLVASDPAIPSDGVHLATSDPFPSDRPFVLGGSCHSLPDVHAAEERGLDYVTLSPIFESASKPGYGPPLGLQGQRDIVDEVLRIPIFALGGIDAEIANACLRAGATGVAVMGEIMRSPDPASTVAALLDALGVTAAKLRPAARVVENVDLDGWTP